MPEMLKVKFKGGWALLSKRDFDAGGWELYEEAQEAQVPKEEPEEPEEPADEMTKNEIMAALDARGVQYNPRDKKAVLMDLYEASHGANAEN